ncbi:unnamed protein product [Polarella glacialis]|uniref:Uncharacterized protein n=1 Tax=Polarella glacialis TaxID=89957 RepID=A0A813DHS6_POLGL|nr:unnamed protein product [Polarella glacialis]
MEVQPQKKRRPQTQVDDSLLQTTARLLLATTSELRMVKAAATTAVIFPTSHPVPVALRKKGHIYCQAVKERKGSQTLPPPHLSAFTALARTVADDKQAGQELIDAARKVLQCPTDTARLATVCKLSECFKADQARLEIAVSLDGHLFLRQCIELWTRQGATERPGAGPRRPLERSLAEMLSG